MAPSSKLRSRAWFDNPQNIDMTSLCLERYLNFGISLEELRDRLPIIGIAQTGSDRSPCNRHHLVLAQHVREGVRKGIHALPCVGDGRQSGTSASHSILNAAPEAAAGGGFALLRTGNRVRIDLRRRSVDVLVNEADLSARRRALEAAGGFAIRASQTAWQQIQRSLGQLNSGAILAGSDRFQQLAQSAGVPRDNH